jgi:hypothetical protein
MVVVLVGGWGWGGGAGGRVGATCAGGAVVVVGLVAVLELTMLEGTTHTVNAIAFVGPVFCTLTPQHEKSLENAERDVRRVMRRLVRPFQRNALHWMSEACGCCGRTCALMTWW